MSGQEVVIEIIVKSINEVIKLNGSIKITEKIK